MKDELLDPEKICRACLGLLDRVKYDMLQSSDLFELFVRLSTSKADPDDPLSKALCQKCFNSLNEFDAFQKMCVLSYNTLHSCLTKIKLKSEEYNAEGVIDEQQSGKTISNNIDVKHSLQNYVDVKLEDYSDPCRHVLDCDPLNEGSNQDREPIDDEKVPAFDESDDELLAEKIEKLNPRNTSHTNTEYDKDSHASVNETINYSRSSKKDTVQNVSETRRKYRKKQELRNDTNRHHNSEANIQSGKSVSKRREDDQRRTDPFTCKKCSKKFYTKVHYEGHMRRHEGKKPYICDKCPREYSRLSRLRDHISNDHSGEQIRFYCTIEGCERKYRNRQSLDKHVNSHLNPNQQKKSERITVICELCGKSLSKNVLREHEMMHKGIFPHACDQCPKKFRFLNKLEQHKLAHLGIKKYSCPVCGMRKTTKKEVKAHMNVHTREKEYPCQSCKACFLTKANLVRHIRVVHDRIKTFHCTYCDQLFGKSETLKHHMMRHTGERPHKCPHCERRFIQKAAMKIHARRHDALAGEKVGNVSAD